MACSHGHPLLLHPGREGRSQRCHPMAILQFNMGLSYHHLRLQVNGSVSNTDSSLFQLLASAAVLAISKSSLIVWAPGRSSLSGNELAATTLDMMLQRLNPTTHSNQLYGKLSSAVPVPPFHPTRAAEGGVHVSPC